MVIELMNNPVYGVFVRIDLKYQSIEKISLFPLLLRGFKKGSILWKLMQKIFSKADKLEQILEKQQEKQMEHRKFMLRQQ